MKGTRTYFSMIVLITGLMGLFFSWNTVICDDGLIPRDIGVKNEAGEIVLTQSQAYDCVKQFVESRSSLWAVDLLSIYVLFHGIFWMMLDMRKIRETISNGGMKSFAFHLTLGIPLGITFWIVVCKIISKTGMLARMLHE